jgi:hypothetical protein
MKRSQYFLYLIAAGILLAGACAAEADQAATPESRMRDALRNTMLQLRTVTTDRDNLQAQVDDLKSQKDELDKKVADLMAKAVQNQEEDNKQIAYWKGRATDQEGTIAADQKTIDDKNAELLKNAKIANETEAKRAKLADLAIRLQRIVDDQKRRNDQMFKMGMEVLERYEKFGLGQALVAKEPFVGITRAKFETLVQDYEDKLTDQRITEQKSPDQKPKQ